METFDALYDSLENIYDTKSSRNVKDSPIEDVKVKASHEPKGDISEDDSYINITGIQVNGSIEDGNTEYTGVSKLELGTDAIDLDSMTPEDTNYGAFISFPKIEATALRVALTEDFKPKTTETEKPSFVAGNSSLWSGFTEALDSMDESLYAKAESFHSSTDDFVKSWNDAFTGDNDFANTLASMVDMPVIGDVISSVVGLDIDFNIQVMTTTTIETGRLRGVTWGGFATEDVPAKNKIETDMGTNSEGKSVSNGMSPHRTNTEVGIQDIVIDRNGKNSYTHSLDEILKGTNSVQASDGTYKPHTGIDSFETEEDRIKRESGTSNTPAIQMYKAGPSSYTNMATADFEIVSKDSEKTISSERGSLVLPVRIKSIAYDSESIDTGAYGLPSREVAFSKGKSKISGESSITMALDSQLHLLSWIYACIGDFRFLGNFTKAPSGVSYRYIGGNVTRNKNFTINLSIAADTYFNVLKTQVGSNWYLRNVASGAKIYFEDIRFLGTDTPLAFGANKAEEQDITVGFTYKYKYILPPTVEEKS